MPHHSLRVFDQAIRELPHYRAFPVMMPFVGPGYLAPGHARLLLVGESFYFPHESTIHLDADRWYACEQSHLNPEELTYIDCRALLECSWSSPGHEMYREINRCLHAVNLPAVERPIEHIAFTNLFLRPASVPGGSFAHCCTARDGQKAIEALAALLRVLQPELVIFVSKFAWNVAGASLTGNSIGAKIHFVSHPADPRHWRKASYAHGRPKFLRLLQQEFLRVGNRPPEEGAGAG